MAKKDRERYDEECQRRDEEALRRQEERRKANELTETSTRMRNTTVRISFNCVVLLRISSSLFDSVSLIFSGRSPLKSDG
jgi:hypothetical protein